MSGKTALVTGSSRGIGLSLCRELHHQGWKVIATCRNPSTITSEPFYKKLKLAVDDDGSIEEMVREVDEEKIDLLINNAGILTRGMDSIETFNRETFIREFNIDAVSPMMVTKALLPNLLACKGNVINISSLYGSITDAGAPRAQAYRAAKSALNMLTKVLHLEMKDRLGYVVAFHPGLVATDMVGGPRDGAISPEEAASCIIKSFGELTPDKNGGFVSRHGEIVPWGWFQIKFLKMMELRFLTGQKVFIYSPDELDQLRSKIEELKSRLSDLSSTQETCKDEYIYRLHAYNDIKDFCQYLMGKLAQMEETTVAALYPRFGLDPTD